MERMQGWCRRLVIALVWAGVTGSGVAASGAVLAPATVCKIKSQPDKAPDCTSLSNIVASITRNCKNNDDKAVAVYNFMMLSHYHRQYPEGGPVLREMNTFGWSLCGGLQSEQSALWKALGWNWRFIGWQGHTTGEAFYDNRWHFLDVFLKFYCWVPDANAPGGRTIGSQADLAKDAGTLITQFYENGGAYYIKDDPYAMVNGKANWAAQSFLNCGDGLDGCFAGAKFGSQHPGGADESWMGQDHNTGDYCADVNLVPGEALVNTWESIPDGWYWPGNGSGPTHTCPNNKDLRTSASAGQILEPYFKHQRSWCNGTLSVAPNFGSKAVLASFAATENVKCSDGALVPAEAGRPGSVTLLLQSPYVMVKASGVAEGADSFEVSDGKSFKASDLKTFKSADITNFTAAVKGKVVALVKIGFNTALKSVKLTAVVENNAGSLAYLSPGRNAVTVSVEDPNALLDNRLVVTYAYAPGYRATSNDQLCQQGKRIANQADATWADTPTVVRKVFKARDLPATFTIDVPTPKDKYPVYPRMLFVSRELIGPNARLLPLPDKAQEPQMASAYELKTLPDPFLVGARKAGEK